MKILVLGGTGMLGNAVVKYFSSTKHEIFATFRDYTLKTGEKYFYFDPCIESFDRLQGFDYIINCIGVIKPFVQPETMKNTIFLNSIFPRNLADYCEKQNQRLIHITTDCVFSGKDGFYDEKSPHDCLDAYGKSKSLGEPENCMVIRTSIIGNEIHKYASLIAWVKSNKGKEINGYKNHFWNGVTTTEYAKICSQIIDKDLFFKDLFHIFSNDVTKFELVSLINQHYKLNIVINEQSADESIDRRLRTVKNFNSLLSIDSLDEQIRRLSDT